MEFSSMTSQAVKKRVELQVQQVLMGALCTALGLRIALAVALKVHKVIMVACIKSLQPTACNAQIALICQS